MLLAIILTACPADLAACRRERIPAMGGFATAPQAIADWIGEHEGYRVIEMRMGR